MGNFIRKNKNKYIITINKDLLDFKKYILNYDDVIEKFEFKVTDDMDILDIVRKINYYPSSIELEKTNYSGKVYYSLRYDFLKKNIKRELRSFNNSLIFYTGYPGNSKCTTTEYNEYKRYRLIYTFEHNLNNDWFINNDFLHPSYKFKIPIMNPNEIKKSEKIIEKQCIKHINNQNLYLLPLIKDIKSIVSTFF